MIPVILSGGSGSRLWPLSRKQFPKQFLALTGEHTLFQQTLERLVFEGMDTPIVVCNKDHRFIVNEQLAARKLDTQRILMEPFGRNTAPAVALTAMMLVNEGRDDLMLVLPADHPRKPQASHAGRDLHFSLPATLHEQLKGLSRSAGVTLYSTLLAAFQLMLHRLSGSHDVVLDDVLTPLDHALDLRAPGVATLSDALLAALAKFQGAALIGPRSNAKTVEFATPVPLPPNLPGLDAVVARVESLPPDVPVELGQGGALRLIGGDALLGPHEKLVEHILGA